MSAREKHPLYPPDLPLFPSDIRSPSKETFALAGRVMATGGGTLTLADAFTAASVAGEAAVTAGDLVVLEVHDSDKGLVLVRVLERHTPAVKPAPPVDAFTTPHLDSPPPVGEVERFIEGRVGRTLRDRARAIAIVRSFFEARAFLEVDTPLLVPSPGLDLHLDAVEATGGYLITSPEYQMKRLLTGGVPRQFQIVHVFRQGETGVHHNPEFTMLEWYRAFAGVEHVMRDTEELVTELVLAFGSDGRLPGPRGDITVTPPFPRLSVAEAFARYADVEETEVFRLAREDTDTFFRLLVERVEPALGAATTPVFLVDYPIEHASLARAKPSDPRVCERFELYLGGLELCNGFGELTDAEEQRQRLLRDQRARAAAGKAVYPIDQRFLAALAEGMPPSAGNALGIDRIIALCLGEHEIARVLPFPAGIV
ncbi:MAG TPA: EF-P lysine aminoacylase EpmA [Polyangiaceae bacterium]|nr:EF-P lysine aminoacylase EpmA [Polyangiaceae bacterium]